MAKHGKTIYWYKCSPIVPFITFYNSSGVSWHHQAYVCNTATCYITPYPHPWPTPPLMPPPPTAVPLYSWATARCIKLSLALKWSAPPFSSRQSRSRQAWVIHWPSLPLALSCPIYFMLRLDGAPFNNEAACLANCIPEFLILTFIQTAGRSASTCWLKSAHSHSCDLPRLSLPVSFTVEAYSMNHPAWILAPPLCKELAATTNLTKPRQVTD